MAKFNVTIEVDDEQVKDLFSDLFDVQEEPKLKPRLTEVESAPSAGLLSDDVEHDHVLKDIKQIPRSASSPYTDWRIVYTMPRDPEQKEYFYDVPKGELAIIELAIEEGIFEIGKRVYVTTRPIHKKRRAWIKIREA